MLSVFEYDAKYYFMVNLCRNMKLILIVVLNSLLLPWAIKQLFIKIELLLLAHLSLLFKAVVDNNDALTYVAKKFGRCLKYYEVSCTDFFNSLQYALKEMNKKNQRTMHAHICCKFKQKCVCRHEQFWYFNQ